MDAIGQFPFYGVGFGKDGSLVDPAQKTALLAAVRDTGVTDLLVASHGWNNDMAEARHLYDTLFSNLSDSFGRSPPPAGRRYAVAGVFWPSKRFADSDLIPGGSAASLGGGGLDDDGGTLPAADLKARLVGLKGTFDGPDAALQEAAGLADRLEGDAGARDRFAALIRSVLPQQPRDTRDDASDLFFTLSGRELFGRFEAPVNDAPTAGDGGGVADLGEDGGSAAGLGDVLSGAKAAAWRLLNYATYYQMKQRAGTVGGALNGLLGEIKAGKPALRLHMIGHSFGARLVTAAVDGGVALQPSNLCLLQGAFSHNGFTPKFDGTTDGFFRNVVAYRKVGGVIAITHTVNDKAVGLAYPLASRLVDDRRTELGDENDVFGGMGRNGAVKMPAAECLSLKLQPPDGRYAFTPGKVHNLLADAFIASHGDVGNAAVANMLRWAVTAA